jgi:hypothetical protein
VKRTVGELLLMVALAFGVVLLGIAALLFLQTHYGHTTTPAEVAATIFLTLGFLATFWAGLVAI